MDPMRIFTWERFVMLLLVLWAVMAEMKRMDAEMLLRRLETVMSGDESCGEHLRQWRQWQETHGEM